MQLEILTPEKSVFKGEVTSIQLPGSNGLFGVLNKHAPFLTDVEPGILNIKHPELTSMFIGGGFFEVQNNKAVILADSIEKIEEIDINRVNESVKRAKARLAEKKNIDVLRANRSLKRALERKKFKEKV